MRISGLVGLYVGKPQHPIGPDGRMALSDHLRELRARILKIVTVLVVGLVVSLFFFDPIFELVLTPYKQAAESLGDDVDTQATIAGAGGPLMLYLKLCGVVSVIATSPLWLYQIWAFILPGPAQPGAQVEQGLRRGGGAALPRRRRARLLHPSQGPGDPDRADAE